MDGRGGGGLARDESRGRFRRAIREFLFGMGGFDFARHALETRAQLETMFMLVTMGDMVGLPLIPTYYSLRFLPYVTPEIATWKRRVLREREFHEEHEYDLHGV
jgi:hypothetical protein